MAEEPAVISAPSLAVPEVLAHPCIDALVTAIFLKDQSLQEICVDKGLFCSIYGGVFFSFLMILSSRSNNGHKEKGMLLWRGKRCYDL